MIVSEVLFVPLMVLSQVWQGSVYGAGYRLTLMVTMSAFMASQTPILLYTYVSRKKKRGDIYFAMLPASKLEKYLSIVMLSMVIVPLALAVGNIGVDSLLTTLHFPMYHKYLWQTDFRGMLSLPMLCCCLLAFIGPTFGFIYTNAVRNKAWRTILYLMLWLWLLGGMLMPLIMQLVEESSLLWIVAGAEAVLTPLMAWLGWNKMNKIGY